LCLEIEEKADRLKGKTPSRRKNVKNQEEGSGGPHGANETDPVQRPLFQAAPEHIIECQLQRGRELEEGSGQRKTMGMNEVF